jgi:CPA1 family monovalent cation:H+ antiporter
MTVPESQVAALVIILMAAAAVAMVVKVVPVPYVSALALAGLLAEAVLGHHEVHLTQDLILVVLVPGLLFEAAYSLSWRELRQNLLAVIALATLGVLLTTAVVALLGHAALGLSIPVAILFGTMVAPTDPVAVVAVFEKMRVPARLINLIEAESLLNDGTGVVLFTLALAAIDSGFHASPWAALAGFLHLGLGGLGIGLGMGLVLSLVTMRVNDFQIEMTLTAIAAYGSYLLADQLRVSGLLAVVGAGLVMGNYGRPRGMTPQTRQAVDHNWEYVAFVLNSVVFILIGLDVPLADLLSHLGPILLAAGIALLARAASVYLTLGPLHLVRSGVDLRWQHLLVWSGLRGALALALVLIVSQRGGEFGTISALVYGVVLASILVQGTTIGPIARLLRLPTEAVDVR